MEVKRKNLKEDFKLLVSLGETYKGYNFELIFTAGKYGNNKFFCSFDGENYENCIKVDDTHVLCLMDNHGLPCGLLSVETVIHIPDPQMPDGDFKKSDKRLFEFMYNGHPYHLEFTNGKSDDLETPEILLDIIGTVIQGKPFSYEDLTEEQKEQISKPALDAVDGKQDLLISGETIKTINGQSILGSGNLVIESNNGYEPPVGGIPKTDLSEEVQQSLSKADTALQQHQDISTKQDVIDDLDAIREGASLGNTSLQPDDIVGLETKEHADQTYQVKIDDLSSIREGAALGATSVQPKDIEDMETKTHVEENYQMKGNYALEGASYTKGESDERFLTEHQDLSGKQDTLVSGVNIKTINGFSLLGDGNLRIEGGGSSGGYTPPSDGIPKSDLADDVIQSLSKADTALQEHQDISGKADKSVVDSISDELADVKATAETAEEIAKGKSSAMVFDIVENMVAWMSNAENKGKLKRGDNIYIEAKNLPDYWISAVLDAPNEDGLYYEYAELETDKVNLSVYVKDEELANVAKSGNYNDLTNKPEIPSEVTEQTVEGWGFSKTTGTYTKPDDGIPFTDLDSGVQSSLSKADSALQSHQDISGKQDVISDLDAIRSGAALGATSIQSHQDISGKQDVISDLAAIRSGASKGATAVQPSDLATMQATVAAAIASFEERLPS